MKHHFLHISDLHYRKGWPEQTQLVCDRFFSDLTSQKEKYPDAHLIFSGDLVQAGGDPGLYAEFLKDFDERLNKVGFPFDRRICIPGNHDISRAALGPNVTMQQGALSVMKDETTFNNNLAKLSKTFFSETFKGYIECETKFARFTCCAANLGGTGHELSGGVGVYCLNTALCSFGGLEDSEGTKINDKGHLSVDTRSLYQWLHENKSDTRILVLHHPLDSLVEWARDELNDLARVV